VSYSFFYCVNKLLLVHALPLILWSRTEAGDKFVVKDQLRLAGDCIPRYFSHCNFSSFTRQLNFYRFRKMFPAVKIGPGNEVGNANEKHLIFYHEKFHRDHPGEQCLRLYAALEPCTAIFA